MPAVAAAPFVFCMVVDIPPRRRDTSRFANGNRKGSAMAKVIVGIHGLANKPPKRLLTQWWRQSICEGLDKNCGVANPAFKFHMVYWADLLYLNRLHDNKQFDFDKLYNDEPYMPAGRGKLERYDDGVSDTVVAGLLGLIGAGADFAKDKLNIEGLADWVLGKLLKDLDFYYDPKRKIGDRSKPPKMALARTVLMDELKRALLPLKGEEIMLISHSMGTIIAYDVLRDIGKADPGFEVSHFATIGSPLGLPHVKKKIIDERRYSSRKESGRVRTPTVVSTAWKNFADRKDPVAVDVHLHDDFGPNRRGIAVEDDLVANRYKGPAGKENHHKSYGYLRAPEVSEFIRDFLA